MVNVYRIVQITTIKTKMHISMYDTSAGFR